MSKITLKNISKKYEDGSEYAVRDFNLEIEEKEFIVFVGPSGCGKSTTLRMIAGLESISEGELLIDGQKMNDVPAKDRQTAMVFQNYALYPHLNVYDNIGFGLKIRGVEKRRRDEMIKNTAEMLDLSPFLKRKPSELSGGQKQRVALGRAIVKESDIFLMDEPLSNLDAKLRVQMREEIVHLQKKLGSTTIYVTHDQSEAMTMATRIVCLRDGIVQKVGTPEELYLNPCNIFVAGFLGSPAMNFIKGRIENGNFITDSGTILAETDNVENQNIIAGIRPEYFHLSNSDEGLPLDVKIVELLGADYHVHSDFEGNKVVLRTDIENKVEEKTRIFVSFKDKDLLFFNPEDGRRIYR